MHATKMIYCSRAPCLMLKIKKFRCYEVKTKEFEKAGSHWESSTYRGLWLSGYHGSVADHWWFEPEVSWVRLPATAGLFTFPCFCLITSKFLY